MADQTTITKMPKRVVADLAGTITRPDVLQLKAKSFSTSTENKPQTTGQIRMK